MEGVSSVKYLNFKVIGQIFKKLYERKDPLLGTEYVQWLVSVC